MSNAENWRETGRRLAVQREALIAAGVDPSELVVPLGLVDGSTSDGYHTYDELYEFRMLYHAAFVNTAHAISLVHHEAPPTVKSLKHSDGEWCFGGGWFIVVTELPNGQQISNHYEAKHWDLFQVPAVDVPPAFDGHTTEDVVERLRWFAEFWAGRGR